MPDKPKILLVDDKEENLVALEALLRRDDTTLLRARSGAEALELLLVHDMALALVDVQMPEMDGIQLAELMRGTTRTREIPILFVTAGMHDPAHIFRGYEAGAVDFIYKPFDPVILRSKVEVFLQLYRQRQLLAEQVSDLRDAERALREADRRKNEFLGVLSHELRNPLAPIRNAIYILKNAPEGSDRTRHAKEVIERQTNQLVRLVDDLLDVTRISRGKIQLHKERVELTNLLRQVVGDHKSLFDAREVALSLNLDCGPVWMEVDSTRIAQAVGNLLSNAAKFTEAHGHVAIVVSHKNPSGVTIEVTDDGIGIESEMVTRLFEPFAQADESLHRGQGGLGLGLALVKGLVEMHDGQVKAHSRGLGLGATFEISLPHVLGKAHLPVQTTVTPPDVAHPLRLLIVEDNVDAAETLKEALEAEGHEVFLAHDGQAGVAKAKALRPDMVLCDIGLPHMDGFEVARRIRSELWSSPTLIALTGYARPEDQRKTSEAGFDHHLAKPVNVSNLLRVLSSVASRPTSRRVLVIEENDALCATAKDLLESDGWEVRVARSTREGLAIGPEFLPALILLDRRLPDREVVRRLGAINAPAAVVLMGASSRVRELTSQHGFRLYVPRPFPADAILDSSDQSGSEA